MKHSLLHKMAVWLFMGQEVQTQLPSISAIPVLISLALVCDGVFQEEFGPVAQLSVMVCMSSVLLSIVVRWV